MNKNLSVGTSSKAVRFLNMALLIVSTITAIGVIAINSSRDYFVQISNQIFSPEKPLMDSYVLDLLLRKGTSIIILIFTGWIILKEKKIESVRRRLGFNIVAFAGLAVYAVLIIYFIYAPIWHAK